MYKVYKDRMIGFEDLYYYSANAYNKKTLRAGRPLGVSWLCYHATVFLSEQK